MAQVTKPMALDETLQDVVTALQNITQGGHIVYSGTVGSTTQPIYLDGGVPTAGESFTKANTFHVWESASYSLPATAGWYKLMDFTPFTSTVLRFGTSYAAESQGILFVNAAFARNSYGSNSPCLTYIGSIFTTQSPKFRISQAQSGQTKTCSLEIYHNAAREDISIDLLYSTTADYTLFNTSTASSNTVSLFEITKKEGDAIITTGNIRQPILTGTPTDINTYLTATRTEVHKSGNVVHVNLKFTIASAFQISASTRICKLPYNPSTTYPWLTRMAGSSNDASDHYWGASYIDTSGYICLGEAPYTGLTSGNNIWVYGTYLTDD